jgi:hypothetical protein
VLHHYYVGHFDPRDYLDMSAKPFRLKARRTLPREAMDRVLADFDPAIAEYVSYEEGCYVACGWGQAPHWLWEGIHRFALALAESEGAVVMSEPPGWVIEYPEEARRSQEDFWAHRPGRGGEGRS